MRRQFGYKPPIQALRCQTCVWPGSIILRCIKFRDVGTLEY